jgi:serpin B
MSLAVACECANGETRDEILDAIGVTYEELNTYTKYYYSLFNKAYTYIDTYGNEHVSAHEVLATSIWMNRGSKYNFSCINTLSKNYNCDSFTIGFADGTAEKVINQYIEYKTHNVILGDVSISSSADFSIISAYHLKEIWNEFGRNLSISFDDYVFTNSDKSTVLKQFMKSTYSEGVVQNMGEFITFYIVTEHGYTLHFMIPNVIYSIEDVFTPKNISKMISIKDYNFIDYGNKRLHYTRLLFPQISVSYSGDISKNLENDFEISSLFDSEKCDFSNMFFSDASCGSLIHTAKLSLDAKGIEGSAINLGESNKEEKDLPDYEKIYHEYEINQAFGFVLTDPDGLIIYVGEVNTIK